MEVFSALVLFLFGLSVGSFANVLTYRLNDEKAPKFWQGRSLCPKCKHQLSARDNIPLLSFLLLHGRCRYCHEPISWQYPLVEASTAVAFVLVWFLSPAEHGLFVKLDLLAIAATFIVIFFSDLIYGLIPDEMILTGALGALIYNLQFSNLGPYLLTGILSSFSFLLVVVATKFRGMGLGDVKLAFLIGLLLGWPRTLVSFWSAFIIGGVVAVTLLILRKTKLSATIPLGPFLVIGTLVAALWSKELLTLVIPSSSFLLP